MTKQVKFLFIHHSTGGNLIKQGRLRLKLKKLNPNIELWDHSYNLYPIFPKVLALFTHHKGLSDNKGKITGEQYNIVLSNDSPKEYEEIFSRDKSDYTLSKILTYDIIAFKNCYPTTKIVSDAILNLDKSYYIKIKNAIKKYPNNKFILITPPPLRKEMTNPNSVKRSISLVNFLNSKKYLEDIKNLYIFDLNKLLSDDNGYLKNKYTRLIHVDSHPNSKANRDVSPVFAEFISKVATLV